MFGIKKTEKKKKEKEKEIWSKKIIKDRKD